MALIDKLNAVGDAIREKNGTTELIPLVDMPQAILDIVSGGGVEYTSIICNDDNTVTLTDKNGVVHTMECEFDNHKLTLIKYDDVELVLTYDGDVLVSIGETEVDFSAIEPEEWLECIQTLVGDVTPIQEELQVASDMLGGQDV